MIRNVIYLGFIALLTQCAPVKSDKTVQQAEAPKVTTKVNTMPAVDIDYIMGKFDPESHDLFVKIEKQYADREGMYLRKEAMNAFIKMRSAAAKEGITMTIRSATRNFDYQKGIWERKYTGATILSDGTNVKTDIPIVKDKCLKILEYSSMPSTSRHHWGTDIDINSFDNSYFEKGDGKKLYDWMLAHATEYGYCQPYTPKGAERPDGYFEEKWHWSYMPISQELTRQAESEFKDKMINGFMGAEAATEIGVVEKYVLGINKSCR